MLAFLVIAASLALACQPAPGSSDREYKRGVELQKRGDLAGARKAYEAALTISPRRVDALSNLGLVYGRAGNYDLAAKTFQRALAVDPGQVVVRFNLGLTFLQAQRFEDARREFTKLRAAVPEDAAVQKLLGISLLKTSRIEEGIAELEPVARLQPQDLDLAYTLVSAYIKTRRLADAKPLVEGVLSQSNSAEAHFVSGCYYLADGKYPRALEHLQKAHELQPDLPDLKSALADAYAYNANQDVAALLFAEHLARNPRDFKSNLLLGWLYLEADEPEQAAVYLNRAREVRPDDTDLLFQLARLARARGRSQESAKLLQTVISRQPGNRAAHVLLAQTYRRLNRPADAAREQDIVNQINREEMVHPAAPRER